MPYPTTPGNSNGDAPEQAGDAQSGATGKARGKRDVVTAGAKPAPLPVRPEPVPADLTALPQWVCWRWELNRQKWTKVPRRVGVSANAKVNESSTWATFEGALDWLRREPTLTDGVGFVFTESDPFAGVDLDDALDAETGELRPWARPWVERLASYAEVSPSRTGVKLIVRGAWPQGRKHRAVVPGGVGEVEVYDRLRYWTITGHALPGTPASINEGQAGLDDLHVAYFAIAADEEPPPAETTPAASVPTSLEDQDVVDRARRARNGQRFSALWGGDTSAYEGDHSRADMALCCMLAFWTRDEAQLDRLFRASGLRRDKWDERHGGEGQNYGQLTVASALRTVTVSYDPARPRPWRPPGEGDPPPPASEDMLGGGGGGSLPSIVANHRQLREVTADALAAVARANEPPRLFQRGGLLVRQWCDPSGVRPRIDVRCSGP